MEIKSNPYSKKSFSGDYGCYFSLLYSYAEIFSSQPNVYEFSTFVKSSSIGLIEREGGERLVLCEVDTLSEGKPLRSPLETCYRIGDALVYFYRREGIITKRDYESWPYGSEDADDEEEDDDDSETFRCKVAYSTEDSLARVLLLIERAPERKRKGNVHLLCSLDGMLTLQRFEVKLPPKGIQLELNYGDEAAAKFEKVVSYLSGDKNGLVLLSGDPGTGKSTFIKYLTTKTTRKVIYLSSGAADHLTNPDFLTFIMRHRNCVLLLEDAEKVLRSRDTQDNSAISNILNITDGILGDCLNILVVATFNIEREQIDSALVRKGRLLVEHHFEPLSEEASNKVLENIGSDRKASGPTTLADLYNSDENFHEKKEEKKKVGF